MKVAILGATGAVGRTMLEVLATGRIPVDEIVPLASERSVGTSLRWGGRDWIVRAAAEGAFRGVDIALFSAGASRSRAWADAAAAEGAVVIDNSSAWRMEPDVPLVVPEVNGPAASERPRGIIANPNCATIQLVVAAEAIRRAAGLARIVVSTYQSVSGAGQQGLTTLRGEIEGSATDESPFPAPIAGNVIPLIGPRGEDGWTEEEDKIRAETRKILALPGLAVAATCVRVPVEVGHAVAATFETESELGLEGARAALAAMPGLAVLTDGREPLPRDAAGRDDVLVGRLRLDRDRPRTLHLWIVADNLRKGAATNAVQIAELVVGR
jgi:aspartate-semialdehyde dehydrogenase